MIGAPKVTREKVRQILHDPPDFIEYSYLPAWTAGRFSTRDLGLGVVAALGRSAYDGEVVDEVTSILESMGYGEEPISAVWL